VWDRKMHPERKVPARSAPVGDLLQLAMRYDGQADLLDSRQP